jgi:hypothetical protein
MELMWRPHHGLEMLPHPPVAVLLLLLLAAALPVDLPLQQQLNWQQSRMKRMRVHLHHC